MGPLATAFNDLDPRSRKRGRSATCSRNHQDACVRSVRSARIGFDRGPSAGHDCRCSRPSTTAEHVSGLIDRGVSGARTSGESEPISPLDQPARMNPLCERWSLFASLQHDGAGSGRDDHNLDRELAKDGDERAEKRPERTEERVRHPQAVRVWLAGRPSDIRSEQARQARRHPTFVLIDSPGSLILQRLANAVPPARSLARRWVYASGPAAAFPRAPQGAA